MNALLWAFHIGVLYYAWPLLRDWWRGAVVLGRRIERKRWLVALSIGMVPLAALWLLPFAIAHRADQRKQESLKPAEWTQQRAADVAFWREQVAIGDFVSAWVGVELLAMWNVPAVEPEPEPPRSESTHREPQAVPGAHEYSHGCDCRNCVRARRAEPGLLTPPSTALPAALPATFAAQVEAAWAAPTKKAHARSCICPRCRSDLWEKEIHL